jgi:quercetin dioxygenase-like cupin family protein
MSERERADELRDEAALYALGALDPDEARRVEVRLLEGDRGLRAEIDAFASAVAHLGHAASPVPPEGATRARLLDTVRAASRPTIVRADEGRWDPMPAGSRAKSLLRDRLGGRATTLVRLESGSVYPSHRHRETEELYILEGTLHVLGHRLGPGDYCAARGGSVHRSASTDVGCHLLVSASEEDELLESAEPSPRGLLFVPGGQRPWRRLHPGVAVRRLAVDAQFGVATVVVRMEARSRYAVRGREIYVLEGEAQLADGAPLRAGDFCGAVAGTVEVAESATGCRLLVLAARGTLAQEVGS